ncbi:MAG: NADH:flavin oxidoreductase [Pseudomonadota bacterium]
MTDLLAPLTFARGPAMKNRFMLAPLTNTQSQDDGVLSDDEFRWLTMRAEGGFGLTMTCAAHVQAQGRGFPGQLGVFDDRHIDGLARLANAIQRQGSLSSVQLHHAGQRSPAELIGTAPVCPSADEDSGARALTASEVAVLRDDFIAAAVRSERAGFDGVEIHGAHGYVLSQFFSPVINRRDDAYGGTLDNRYRILFEIIDGIRASCRADFQLGVRLSPERFGLRLPDVIEIARRLLIGGDIDFLDMSLWDVFKAPRDENYAGRSLMSCFTELPRGETRLGVAGMIRTPAEAEAAMAAGADWVMLGRAAILQHDFPARYAERRDFETAEWPVTREYLAGQGLSPRFVDYVKTGWPAMVAD